MERTPGTARLTIDPTLLGPLSDGAPSASGPGDLFRGDVEILGRREVGRRAELWKALNSLLGRLLTPGERVVYLARATQAPRGLEAVGLGAMYYAYHQVALVFTDTRLIEILLDARGRKPATRVRTFPWADVKELRMRFGSLRLVPAAGAKHGWSLAARGDRKIVKALLDHLGRRAVHGGAGAAEESPIWHCSKCLAPLPRKPVSCAACGTTFRSSRLAALLSLAFPGGGLLYLGHPWLGTADLLAEAFLFSIIAVGLATAAGPRDTIRMIAAGAIAFVLTKLESIHVGHILAARTIPEPAARSSWWRKAAMGGGIVSVVALAGSLTLAGRFAAVLDHDLDFSGDGAAWTATRSRAEWTLLRDDPGTRSEWTHDGGYTVAVLANALGGGDTPGGYFDDFRAAMETDGGTVVRDDEDVPPPFQGHRYVRQYPGREEGDPYVMIDYLLYDSAGNDVHHVISYAVAEEASDADALVRDMIAHGRWVEAIPPSD